MQSTAMFFRSRATAWVLVAGAVSPSVMAQGPTESTASEKAQAEAVPGPGAAQQSEPDGPASWNRRKAAPIGVDAQLRRLTVDLKLDAAQQPKVRTILVARNEEMQRLQHDTLLTPGERRQRALAIGDRSAEQIRGQLTDAQRAQYIRPRAATTPAQARAAARRGGPAALATTAPNKGVTP